MVAAALSVIVEVLLVGAALLLALPAAVLLVECLAAAWPTGRRAAPSGPERAPRAVVLLPAHDEELGIGATVAALVAERGPADRVLVVADNCGDRTAERARAAGAEVVERSDPERRGKGYAIEFGLRQLAAAPPEVVLIVDADCRLAPGGVRRLAALAQASGRPVQGEYLLGAPPGAGGLALVSALAILVRNRVRPRGLLRLGLPCQLTGSGMAFPWRVLRQAPATDDNLVEDLVMGLEMARAGHPPLHCPEVAVTSELPAGRAAAMKQRRRWEHGQLHTLVRQAPRLLAQGLRRRELALVALALDLVVPPLALFVPMLLALTLISAVSAFTGFTSPTPLLVAGAALAATTLAILVAWWTHGRRAIPARGLLLAPLYILWKIPLYLSALAGRRQRRWERTQR